MKNYYYETLSFKELELVKQYAKDILNKNFKNLRIKEVIWFTEIMKMTLEEALKDGNEFVS